VAHVVGARCARGARGHAYGHVGWCPAWGPACGGCTSVPVGPPLLVGRAHVKESLRPHPVSTPTPPSSPLSSLYPQLAGAPVPGRLSLRVCGQQPAAPQHLGGPLRGPAGGPHHRVHVRNDLHSPGCVAAVHGRGRVWLVCWCLPGGVVTAPSSSPAPPSCPWFPPPWRRGPPGSPSRASSPCPPLPPRCTRETLSRPMSRCLSRRYPVLLRSLSEPPPPYSLVVLKPAVRLWIGHQPPGGPVFVAGQ
jgi:hypothetical protein